MATKRGLRVTFGLSELADTFKLEINTLGRCMELENWLDTSFEFTDIESHILEELYLDVQADGNYWNEEELKIEMIGLMFRVAKVKVPQKSKFFTNGI